MCNARIKQGDDSGVTTSNPPRIVSKHRHTRVSKPIPIGLHHTVCGSEAINLAKRLTEELASQQVVQGGSLGNPVINAVHSSPEELRSRSLEQGEKPKGNNLRVRTLFRFFSLLIGTLFVITVNTKTKQIATKKFKNRN